MNDPDAVDEHRAAQLRKHLADQLEEGGHLRSPAWRSAVETVPRHEFARTFFRRSDGPRGTLWAPVVPGPDEVDKWLAEVYTDRTLVTQLDGHLHPEDVDAPVQGDPTSSSTLPSLVVRMLEDLDPRDGDRVLLVGVGAGLTLALLSERLGSTQVTGVECDEGAAARARSALAAAGYEPAVITGDGLLGHAAGAPYDRLIATCSVRAVPAAWLEQVRLGGTIVTAVSGWLYGSGLVRLTVGDGGTATGPFLPGTVSFMIARPQAAPPPGNVSDLLEVSAADERRARYGPGVLGDWMPQFLAQLAVPGAQYRGMAGADGLMLDHLIDVGQKSFATLVPDGGGFLVRQGGPVRLWDAVEEAIDTWREAGSPPQSAFGLTVGPGGQRVWLGDPDGPGWILPT
ncbi:ATP-grasp peptide maturase system methyltransferase [Streptomyces sp. ISL-11]|uniref:ATP-grasp peptide maturase system methyltransferase n=1 Tax=Streptomyces sp. ISL-11 TaxID=2819174 RepID=UPI001BE71FF0|nr:ATP-grasp peptide maturase system methyltransferase [Streptomyces sp. ISL-11]MBT2386576.1 ATP-grasp peptide maturase system methyltransferase [Streptomyces sp. ISL-11]